MKHAWFRRITVSSSSLVVLISCLSAQAQTDQRWYQIEVTLFAHDNAMQAQEHWPLETLEQPLPRNTRALVRIVDVLSLPEWQATAPESLPDESLTANMTELAESAIPLQTSDFRFPDPERDAFIELPASAHGFTDTNRALTSSASYRVLYHNTWRQPLSGANQATPIWVSGGELFGNRHELEGTLTVRFNPGQDRVVLDARLWLSQFSAEPAAEPAADGLEIRLPDLPQSVTDRLMHTVADEIDSDPQDLQIWHPVQIIPVVNSREMRSNEFHYVDHPAIGIVVQVFPYTVPPLPTDSPALL